MRSAAAVSVNVTATGHDTDGFVTAFGCGASVPEASTLNQRVGEANANGAIVPVGADSTGCVFTSSATNVIVDLNGWVAPRKPESHPLASDDASSELTALDAAVRSRQSWTSESRAATQLGGQVDHDDRKSSRFGCSSLAQSQEIHREHLPHAAALPGLRSPRFEVSPTCMLTAGTRYDQEKARDGQPIPTTVVTLLVTPSDAERIALAASEGEVMLTLRNPMDRKPTETTGIRTAALLGQAPAPPPVVRDVNRAASRTGRRRRRGRHLSRRFTPSRPSGPPNVLKRLSANEYRFLVRSSSVSPHLLGPPGWSLAARPRRSARAGCASAVPARAAHGRPLHRR